MPTAQILEFHRALQEDDAATLKGFATDEAERRLRQRRRSHASALIRLCQAELAAIRNEPVEDRRERLRRDADRAEYNLKAFNARERGDHVAARFFTRLAAACQ